MNIQKPPERQVKWKLLVEEQAKSGLSQKDFCKAHELVLSQFVYYRSILKTRNLDHNGSAQLFSPIKIKKDEHNISIEVKIILPNGFQCFVPSQIDASHLKMMMETLLSC